MGDPEGRWAAPAAWEPLPPAAACRQPPLPCPPCRTCQAGCRCAFHLPCVVKTVEQAIRASMAATRQRKFGEVMLVSRRRRCLTPLPRAPLPIERRRACWASCDAPSSLPLYHHLS